ncbi:MAG: GalNAc-alpha-(1-_4)-GalNAc-alpha-(1-_3)-diNAcBac-PP-undecaprenol alpha-1,4-N-acetyl-D-galactosaminyltransferase [Mariniflexile sp.]|jgi:GalNAc-alpha-(1->4)-GalNAc-alpha-(1->3)-diNAcBac-PP-undecaprenol alpha-1,4-N-acetyl-D-galactosaminyltransferase
MKKAFILIPTLTAGGAERVASELLINWCLLENVEVHLILFTKDPFFYQIPSSVKIHYLGLENNKGKFYRLLNLFFMGLKIRKIVTKEKPTFILSFMNKYNIFTVFSLMGVFSKIIVSERDSPTEVLSKFKVLLRNIAYKKVKGLIAQTYSYKKFIMEQLPKLNVKVISNPVREIDLDGHIKENIILTVGRLEPKKGHKYLIEAIDKIDHELGTWKVMIVGDGSQKGHLQTLVNNKKLNHRIEFIGQVKNVEHWLGKSKVFVFPSLFEGFPNALAEALVAGNACLSFNCPTGPSDLIDDFVNGELIPVKDVEHLSNSILKLINDPGLIEKYSTNSRKLRISLNSEKISKQYFDFCISSATEVNS